MEAIIEEIKDLLKEVRYPEEIASAKDILRFVNRFIDGLKRNRSSQSSQGLINLAFELLLRKILKLGSIILI